MGEEITSLQFVRNGAPCFSCVFAYACPVKILSCFFRILGPEVRVSSLGIGPLGILGCGFEGFGCQLAVGCETLAFPQDVTCKMPGPKPSERLVCRQYSIIQYIVQYSRVDHVDSKVVTF